MRNFGSIDKTSTGRFRARYPGLDGRRYSKTFDRKKDASTWLAAAQADQARATWRAPSGREITLEALAEEYLARPTLRVSTREDYTLVWRLHLSATWGGRPVGQVTPSDVRKWWEATSIKPTAKSKAYRFLRAMLQLAVDRELIPANPARIRGAANPPVARPSRALTRSEVYRIVEVIPHRYQALVVVITGAALRLGEAVELRRKDLIWSADGSSVVALRISRAAVRGVVGPPKTQSGLRQVALPATAISALMEHMERYCDAGDDSLLFTTSTGSRIEQSNFSHTFQRAVSRAGLPPVRVHELRHTGATAFVSAGGTIKELQARLGHASPMMALRYTHAVPGRDAEVAARLDI